MDGIAEMLISIEYILIEQEQAIFHQRKSIKETFATDKLLLKKNNLSLSDHVLIVWTT